MKRQGGVMVVDNIGEDGSDSDKIGTIVLANKQSYAGGKNDPL